MTLVAVPEARCACASLEVTSTPNGPGLRRNLTLLCVYHALMMSLFPMAIITLYQQHELGLSMTEIMLLQAIFGVALAVFEFPSGYAADRLGYSRYWLADEFEARFAAGESQAMLDKEMPYQSGPQWLAEHVLRGQHVFAVAGTHGKTTTASLLAWILEDAGLRPGFLIGGVPANFGVSARYGSGEYFVVEADEYDTAFFDKRAKFVHYRPRTLILNNLEYDHADIYADLDAIMWQFHQLLRTVPGSGRILVNGGDENLARLLDKGCWTPRESFSLQQGSGWHAEFADATERHIHLTDPDGRSSEARWQLGGSHNLENALAAVAAVTGVTLAQPALQQNLSEWPAVSWMLLALAAVAAQRLGSASRHPSIWETPWWQKTN